MCCIVRISQHPFYPGTGGARPYEFDHSERDLSSSRVVNVPLEQGASSAEFRTAVSEQIIPGELSPALTPQLCDPRRAYR